MTNEEKASKKERRLSELFEEAEVPNSAVSREMIRKALGLKSLLQGDEEQPWKYLNVF